MEVTMRTFMHPALAVLCLAATGITVSAAPNNGARQFRYSTTVEKERPQLNEATKRLIQAYRRNPSEENEKALRRSEKIMMQYWQKRKPSWKN